MRNQLIVVMVLACILFYSCEKGNEAFRHNDEKRAIEFELSAVRCPLCRMDVASYDHAVQLVQPDGDTFVFDDVGCMILWIDDNQLELTTLVTWVYALDTQRWIGALEAHYSLTDYTPMAYGFGAYEHKQKGFVDFKEMRLRMLRGLTLKDPKIRKRLRGH